MASSKLEKLAKAFGWANFVIAIATYIGLVLLIDEITANFGIATLVPAPICIFSIFIGAVVKNYLLTIVEMAQTNRLILYEQKRAKEQNEVKN